nr:GH32 C-terminal domain-containing protein [Corynebacterium aquatimens]
MDAAAGMLRYVVGEPDALEIDHWHMFYQYEPTPGAPTRWAHQVSENTPYDFYECNDVIAPVGGETNVYAGSVVASDNHVDLYFTSETAAGYSIQVARVEDIDELCDEIDDELQIDEGVNRLGAVVEDRGPLTRFRSPCVVPDWEENDNREQGQTGWLMLASSGPDESPTPVVLSSSDDSSWSVVGPLTFNGETGMPDDVIMVAPRLIRLRDEVNGEIRDVLFITQERDHSDLSGYLVGTLNGATYDVITPFQRIDYGHDFTRPRSTNVVPGVFSQDRRLRKAFIFGLLAPTGRGGDPTTQPTWEAEGWANALSLPRVLTLADGRLYQTPSTGLPNAVSESERASMWTGLCEIPVGSAITAEILDGNGNPAATIIHSGDGITLDRHDDEAVYATLTEDDEDNITIVVDGSTIEVFAGGGAVTMSSRFWPEGGTSGIRVTAEGDAVINNEWRRGVR